MRRRKILHLHFGKEGGAERFFVNLAQEFGKAGQEQRFIIRPGRTWEAPIRALGPVILNNFRRISPLTLVLRWQVRRLVAEWQPDVIMAWMPRAARLIPSHDGAVKLTRLGDFPKHLRHFAHCDVLVGNVPGIGRHCQNLGWTRPVRTITNFPREVEAVPVSRAELDTPDDAFVVSSVGRFVPRKGFDVLLRAVAPVPNAYLWLVGEGKEMPALKALASQLGIAERVRFVGWKDEPGHYVAASDAFVMASRHEPLGNVALEAWSMGVPVVSTRSEGPDWYMTDGVNGVMTAIDDVQAITAGLLRIRDDRAFAQSLVAGAEATLAAGFTKERIVAQYLDLFDGNFRDG
ncbi:MAG: glycosyltransferase [Pseudooceanicola sp.]|nr:glycosyltransferase [Pseudooceanicola sp.]